MEEDGLLCKWLTKLFGKNWKTTLWGTLFTVSLVVATNPLSVEFLPDHIEYWVRGITGFIALYAGIRTFHRTKDKGVTGVGDGAMSREEVDRLNEGEFKIKEKDGE